MITMRNVGAEGRGGEGWSPEEWGPKGGGPEGWGPDLEKVRAPRVGGPKGRAPQRGGSKGGPKAGPKISRFFFPPAREPKRAHLSFPAFKNTTKIQREDPQRERKRAKMGAGEGKKSAKFWAVRRRGEMKKNQKNLSI